MNDDLSRITGLPQALESGCYLCLLGVDLEAVLKGSDSLLAFTALLEDRCKLLVGLVTVRIYVDRFVQ